MKKKILAVVLTVALVLSSVSLLASCKKDDRIVITFSSWDLGTVSENRLNRKMLKAFEEANPEYRVKVMETNRETYSDELQSYAGQQKLPDVFMLDNLALGLKNKWVYDVTETVKNDPDWANLPGAIEDAAKFNDRVLAIPAGMHLIGYFVDDAVFKAENVDPLSINPTYAKFKKAVQDINSTGSISSLSNESGIIDWYAAAMDTTKTLGHYTWDGEKYNIDSPLFADALTEIRYYRANKLTYDSWTADEQTAAGQKNVRDMFRNKKLAMYYAGTWERDGLQYGDESGTTNIFEGDLRFIGIPNGRNIIVPDIYGINKSTANFEGAYQLAKWLSFSPAGISKRMQLDNGTKKEFLSLPLTTDTDVINKYFDNDYEVAGMKDVFLSLEDGGMVEIAKPVPSYSYCRWEVATGLDYEGYMLDEKGLSTKVDRTNATIANIYDDLWKCDTVGINWATIKNDLNKLINDEYAATIRGLNKNYPKL